MSPAHVSHMQNCCQAKERLRCFATLSAAWRAPRQVRQGQSSGPAVSLHTFMHAIQTARHTLQDVDQRITRDVERLAGDVAELVPSLVKPVLDLAWFSSQLWALTGRRGSAILYLYAALGFGCLRCGVAPAYCSVDPPVAASPLRCSIALLPTAAAH